MFQTELKRAKEQMERDRNYMDLERAREQMERGRMDKQALDDEVDLRESVFELAMRVSKLEQGSGANTMWDSYDTGYQDGFSAGFSAALKQAMEDFQARLDEEA